MGSRSRFFMAPIGQWESLWPNGLQALVEYTASRKIFEHVAFAADQVKLIGVEQNPDALYLFERKF
jgi:hypothetical protein